MNKEEKFIIIDKSKENDWYYELNGKIINYLKEDDNYFYVDIRGEMNRITKKDAIKVSKTELEFDDETLELVENESKKLKISRDEFINFLLKKYIKLKENNNE